MENEYITFKQFNNIEVANVICEELKSNGIAYTLNDDKEFSDINFPRAQFENAISLNLQATDFVKAQEILDNFYRKQIQTVSPDYYLFQFSDNELMEIILKPDEWGEFDFHLAQNILKDRGLEIKPEIVELIKVERTREITKPESVNKYLIYRGYWVALFGGIFAIFWGYDIAYSKKILPNGEQVYAYNETERKHGERITLIGIISLIVWIGIFIMIKINQYQ